MPVLFNKVALVTGGSRGIGAAIVKRLVADGASVAFTYAHSSDKANELVTEIEKGGGRAMAIKADNGNASEIEAAVEKTVSVYGSLEILVNSAGMSAYKPIDNHDGDLVDITKLMAVNLTGVSTAVRAATKHLGDGGRIISIGSTVGERSGGFAGFSDYAASKAAVAAYSRAWAWDLGKKGITVNTINPGPTNTDMNPDNSDFAKIIKNSLALGRYGTTNEIAAAVSFLASPDASFITGATLNVDGGQNA